MILYVLHTRVQRLSQCVQYRQPFSAENGSTGFCFLVFILSRWSIVCRRSSHIFLSSRPRTVQYRIGNRVYYSTGYSKTPSVDVKNTNAQYCRPSPARGELNRETAFLSNPRSAENLVPRDVSACAHSPPHSG